MRHRGRSQRKGKAGGFPFPKAGGVRKVWLLLQELHVLLWHGRENAEAHERSAHNPSRIALRLRFNDCAQTEDRHEGSGTQHTAGQQQKATAEKRSQVRSVEPAGYKEEQGQSSQERDTVTEYGSEAVGIASGRAHDRLKETVNNSKEFNTPTANCLLPMYDSRQSAVGSRQLAL